MFIKRYFVEGLAHASYLIGDGGFAAVVDPRRDVEDYVTDAEDEGLRIVAIFNTHPHADFASGFPELGEITGANLYTSHLAPVTYDREPAAEGDTVRIGSLEVRILETPGHSPDSLSYLVLEAGRPVLVFTGDLLFVGDVGRPDLRDADADPVDLAGKLYDSLFRKLLALPDDVKVYPAHGAGSLCGRKLGSAPFTTIGQERQHNWALQIHNRDEFIERMTTNLPDRPAYFAFDVGVNLRGAMPMNELPPLRNLTGPDFEQAVQAGVKVIDIRNATAFGEGHHPGSLNVGIESAMFSTWMGFLVPGDQPILLVADSTEDAAQARLELARIGFDQVAGFIPARELPYTLKLKQLTVCDLKAAMQSPGDPLVLDVRTAGEWEANHLPGALHIPLPELPDRLSEMRREKPLAVLCGSGYRSAIAASLLQAGGFAHVRNVTGGMGAYLEAKCPEFRPADLVFGKLKP